MNIFIKFHNNPPEPHLELQDVVDKRTSVWSFDLMKTFGVGHISAISYNEDKTEGLLTLELYDSKLVPDVTYNGELGFVNRNGLIDFIRVFINA